MLIAAPGDVAKEISSLVSDPRVGVADIKNGDIIRMPMRQQIQPDIDDYILRRVLLRHNIDNTRTFYNPSTDTITDEKTFLARR